MGKCDDATFIINKVFVTHMSKDLSTHLSVRLFVHPSIHPSVCLSACLYVWLAGRRQRDGRESSCGKCTLVLLYLFVNAGSDHISPDSSVPCSYVALFLGAVLRIFSDSVKDSICNLIRGLVFY